MDHISVRKPYPSDLTDDQWELSRPLIPVFKVGRPRQGDMREVLNAILYLTRSGCPWDMLPHDLPAKSTVSEYFAQWRDDGTWQEILDTRRQAVRVAVGKDPNPRAGSIDSQTVQATEIADDRSSDGGQKITGRKRHLVVDTLGLQSPSRVGGVREVAPTVGGGADVRLVGAVSAPQPGLRAVQRVERGVDQSEFDSSHAQALEARSVEDARAVQIPEITGKSYRIACQMILGAGCEQAIKSRIRSILDQLPNGLLTPAAPTRQS